MKNPIKYLRTFYERYKTYRFLEKRLLDFKEQLFIHDIKEILYQLKEAERLNLHCNILRSIDESLHYKVFDSINLLNSQKFKNTTLGFGFRDIDFNGKFMMGKVVLLNNSKNEIGEVQQTVNVYIKENLQIKIDFKRKLMDDNNIYDWKIINISKVDMITMKEMRLL